MLSRTEDKMLNVTRFIKLPVYVTWQDPRRYVWLRIDSIVSIDEQDEKDVCFIYDTSSHGHIINMSADKLAELLENSNG